jgi:hypothetical protein
MHVRCSEDNKRRMLLNAEQHRALTMLTKAGTQWWDAVAAEGRSSDATRHLRS